MSNREVTPTLPSTKWLALLAALVIGAALFALHQGAVWLRDQHVKVATYKPAPGYATQGASREAVHKAYVKWGGLDIRDRSGAACEAHSVSGWAQVLGTPATADAVARELAVSVDPAFRRAAYLGCLDELRN
jgi:hypothetical protein